MSLSADLVSIVVPSYNYAHFLAETVESALAQTHINIEVIIIDDGSSDNTAEVARQLLEKDSRVQYIYQKNQGLSAARNTGIKHAKGDFFIFLDADDLMHPEKVACHLRHFAELPELDLSYGESRYFISGDLTKTFANIELNETQWMPKISGRADTVMPVLIINNIMPVCSVMLRRRLIEKTGDFDASLKSLEDWDYWLRACACDCYFAFKDDERLAAYIRVHGASMSQNNLRMLQVQYLLRRANIPKIILGMSAKKSAKFLLRDNERRRIKAAIHMKKLMSKSDFFEFISGEDYFTCLKIFFRSIKNK